MENDNFDKNEELIKRGFSFDEKTGKINGFNANYFAEFIKSTLPILYAKDDFFYIYKKNVWRRQEDMVIKKLLRDILQEPCFGVWNSKREVEYINALKREVFYEKDLNPKKNLINLKNGIFDTDTFELLPHKKEYLSTIQIPVVYDPEATCERFLRFLDEVFEKDTERITVTQEWFGYSLSTETKAQKALILHGSGGNGKGVCTEMLSLLVGEDNIAHIPLNELHKGFSRVKLHNKALNMSNENESDGKSFNTQYFKAIIGEDIISAEEKGKPVFSFRPTLKFILSMNNLPTTKDKSRGYYRRLMILNFSAYFDETSKDEDLKEKLKAELAGIFNWAIQGLKQLKQNSFKFSKCENMEQMLRDYEMEQNPMLSFFEECIERVEDDDFREDNKIIYNTFKQWASINGHSGYASISSQRFWREFETVAKSNGYKCKSGHSSSLRYHLGIKVIGEHRQDIKHRQIVKPRILKSNIFDDVEE